MNQYIDHWSLELLSLAQTSSNSSPVFSTSGSYEGHAKSSVTNGLPLFYPRDILKLHLNGVLNS